MAHYNREDKCPYSLRCENLESYYAIETFVDSVENYFVQNTHNHIFQYKGFSNSVPNSVEQRPSSKPNNLRGKQDRLSLRLLRNPQFHYLKSIHKNPLLVRILSLMSKPVVHNVTTYLFQYCLPTHV